MVVKVGLFSARDQVCREVGIGVRSFSVVANETTAR